LKKLPITNEIRRLRFENGEMTQKELASRVEVTRQTIVAIENAKYSPSLEVAFKIAEVFGEKLEAVFKYEASASKTERK
jgi:putative transcriptional regulator